MFLRHIDAVWQPELGDLSAGCASCPGATVNMSGCDRQLLEVVAVKVVAQNRQEILAFLDG